MTRTALLLASILIGSLVSAAAGAYVALKDNDFSFAWIRSPDYLFQVQMFEDLVILDYDAETLKLKVMLYSRIMREYQPVTLIANGLTVARQDAIIEDGVIVGVTPAREASVSDLQAGMRGSGVMRLYKDGVYRIDHLLIGDPFPRP